MCVWSGPQRRAKKRYTCIMYKPCMHAKPQVTTNAYVYVPLCMELRTSLHGQELESAVKIHSCRRVEPRCVDVTCIWDSQREKGPQTIE